MRKTTRSWRRTSAPTSTASRRTLTTSSSTSITAPPSAQMVKNNRLAPILNQYKELELGPDKLSGLEMGYIYEELLRRFSEQSGEEAGEHFTPREVIRLMVELLEIPIPDRHFSIYDPACGTGGMLSVAKEHLLDRAATPEEKEQRREVRHRPRAGAFPDQLRHLPGRPAHQERPAGQGLSRQLAHPARPAQQRAGRPVARTQIPLRLHAQQSALRRHLGRQGRLRDRGPQAGEDPLPGRHAARERRRAAVPANHAGQDEAAGRGRQPHRHHLQRLAALQRRLRLGRERNPPLDSGERLARRHRHAARPAFLQHRHLHLHLAAAEREARQPSRPRDAHRRPPAVRERAEVIRQQAQPHDRRPPAMDRGALPRRLEPRATPTSR